MADKLEKNENVQMQIDDSEAQTKKLQTVNYDIEQNKKQESRMMNFFNQEFVDRKIDFKPKKVMNDFRLIPDDMKTIIKNISIYDKLLDIEKLIDEKLYKTRLEIQENLIMPSNRVKGLLRTHIYSYIQQVERNVNIETENSNINYKKNYPSNLNNNIKMDMDIIENEGEIKNDNEFSNTNSANSSAFKQQYEEKYYWVLRIQGKLQPIIDSQIGGFYRKFSYFFNRILIKFSNDNSEKYQDIEWTRVPNSDVDSFEIKRPIEDFDKFCNEIESGIKIKLIFYINFLHQEFKVIEDLGNIIGISQDTRPRILNHIWQYIKINSLQDNEIPNIINLNRELQKIFKNEKLDLSTLTGKLSEFLRPVDPVEIEFTIKQNEDWTENQNIYDFIINVDDPHFLDISNFLSNIDNESILFPKSLFYYKNESQQKNEKSQQSIADSFYSKISDYDRNIQDLIEKLKKLKYKYDFYEAFSKDPKRFIDNFLQQQNSLLKLMKEESSIIDARWDYYSAQYYKDYEDILKEYVDVYLSKLKGSP